MAFPNTFAERAPRIAEARPALRDHPSRLIVETTTRCNLNCAMCVKQSSGGKFSAGDIALATFEGLKPAFPGLESLVLNGIGEPLLHPDLEAMVRMARAAMPADASIGFQSNGHLLDRRRAVSLLAAGLDRLCLSVDSVDPTRFGGIRSGASFAAVERAFEALADARRAMGEHTFALGIEFVAMKPNLEELPRVVEWAAARGVTFMIVSHLFPYEASSLPLAAWDANLELAVWLCEKYRGLARARGLDLGGYLRLHAKYAKTVEDLAVIALVGELQAEAIEAGITVNLARLLEIDTGLYELTRKAFSEAALVAAREGIDISLPNSSPSQARNCEFVESGSAFVSWEGRVHPCYFLWHRYDCYSGGHEMRVTPKNFGRLGSGEPDILDIWNGSDFRTFRNNVTKYEYPYCFNCNLAICDYVQLEGFTQDCHINTEPCAACLWCTGIFRCMT